MSFEHLKVGDPVMVSDINWRHRGWEDQYAKTEVKTVGRVYLTIAYPGLARKRFSRATGKVDDEYGHQTLCTVEARAQQRKRESWVESLHMMGVDLSKDANFSDEVLEKLFLAVWDATACHCCQPRSFTGPGYPYHLHCKREGCCPCTKKKTDGTSDTA